MSIGRRTILKKQKIHEFCRKYKIIHLEIISQNKTEENEYYFTF